MNRTALLALLASLLAAAPAAAASEEATTGNAACLECHAEEDSLTFKNGDKLSIQVKPETYSASVHGHRLLCTDCHTRHTGYPHPERPNASRHAYTLALYETCRACHFANYTRTLESVHFTLQGKAAAPTPVCVDCHGAHDVRPPDRPRADISRKCSQCHKAVFETYARSVHGKALLEDGNEDVPVCTDCHRAHDIADPRATLFKQQTPGMCGRCHADEGRMGRYGLSTAVVETYLSDFHGVTNEMYRQNGDKGGVVAVCTDCHGVHDIASMKGQDKSVVKANLAIACRKCHADATTDFPDAWIGHYEPSADKATLVYGIRLFYWIFIPICIGGLLLQMLLHLWRIAVNR